MQSLLQLLCLVACAITVQADGAGPALAAPHTPQYVAPGQIPMKANAPKIQEEKPKAKLSGEAPVLEEGAGEVKGKPKGNGKGKGKGKKMPKPEEPREDIVDHIAKACPGLQPQVDRLRHEIAHPNQFCRFYLSARRMNSPLADMNADFVMKGCVCLLREDGMGITSSSSGAPQTFVPAQTSNAPESSSCVQEHEEVIRGEYREPKAFCKFFSTAVKRVSPIPGLLAAEVLAGCKCILENTAKTATRTGAWSSRSVATTQPAQVKNAKANKKVGDITTTTIIVKTVIVSSQ